MWIYLLLLLPPLLVAASGRLPARLRRFAWPLAWVALVLFVGLRRELAADWDNYLILFQRAGAYPLAEALTLSDPGYMLLSGLLARLGLALPAVNLACAAIFATGLVKFARAQPLPALAMLIAVPVLVMLAALMSTRQSAALGLTMWALASYQAGGRRLPAALLLGALTFHWTAVLLLPAAIAVHARRVPPWLVAAAGGAAGVGLAAALLFVPDLADRVAHIAASLAAWPRAAPTLAALALLFALWPRLGFDERERRLAAGLAAIALFALALLPVLSAAGDRLGFYAVPLQMMVFTRAVSRAPRGAARRAAAAAVALFYVAMFVVWLAATPYRGCLTPYRSYLADPGALADPTPDRHRRTLPCMTVAAGEATASPSAGSPIPRTA